MNKYQEALDRLKNSISFHDYENMYDKRNNYGIDCLLLEEAVKKANKYDELLLKRRLMKK